MRHSAAFAVSIAVACVAGSSGVGAVRAERAHWVSTADRFALSDQERAALERVAVDGSVGAAGRLRLFYATRPEGEQLREVEHWTRIEVENGGGQGAQATLGAALLELAKREKDERLHRRGCFWLRRAAAAGVEGAAEEITDYRCPTPERTPNWAGPVTPPDWVERTGPEPR